MNYDEFTAAAERKRLKEEARARNKAAWKERNAALKAKKPVGVSKVDDKSRMQMFKEMLLRADNGPRVIGKIIQKAMNDEDKDQAAMLKLCADRFLPVSLFEEAKDGGGITIIIDKTCGGTVTVNDGGGVVIENDNLLGSPRAFQNGE